MGEKIARCNLDKLEASKIEGEMQIAVYLNTVKCQQTDKQMWEKRADKKDYRKFIKAAVEADKEMERVSKSKTQEAKETKVKEEPVGRVDRKKGSKNWETESCERFCFKCGEPRWKSEHSKARVFGMQKDMTCGEIMQKSESKKGKSD